MTKPAQVLDEQGALLSRALDPNYEAMATWMLSSILAKSYMQSPEWAQTARPALTAHWREMVVPSLADASAYHVSTEMLTLARWAGHLLPDDVALQADDLPTASGFLMFEDALEGMEVWGRKTYTHALFWRHTPSARSSRAGSRGCSCVRGPARRLDTRPCAVATVDDRAPLPGGPGSREVRVRARSL